ncbi:hypothetical protein ACRRTK_010205 [Alexandromys fortis]
MELDSSKTEMDCIEEPQRKLAERIYVDQSSMPVPSRPFLDCPLLSITPLYTGYSSHDDTLYSLDVEVTSEILNIPNKGVDVVHCVPHPLQLSGLELLAQLWLKSLQLTRYPENWTLPSCLHLVNLPIHIFFLHFYRYNKEELHWTFDVYSTFYLNFCGLRELWWPRIHQNLSPSYMCAPTPDPNLGESSIEDLTTHKRRTCDNDYQTKNKSVIFAASIQLGDKDDAIFSPRANIERRLSVS